MALDFPANPSIGQVYQQWTWDGVKWLSTAGGGAPIGVQVFTASGTYTPSAGMTTCMVECVGGGGAGGGVVGVASNYAGGGGGGGGGYAREFLTALQVGASQPVTIGPGGTPGAAGNNPGGAGGSTLFGSLCGATGGQGGPSTTSGGAGPGGLGGSAVVGDVSGTGQTGAGGTMQGAINNWQSASAGGSSMLGAGGRLTGSTASNGVAGSGFGGGGSAGWAIAATSQSGAAGAPGVVIITEFSNTITLAAGGGGGPVLGIQVFSASGTYTPTPGMQTAIIECVGGGGGGGGSGTATASSMTQGSGGGGGGYSRKFVTAPMVSPTTPVTIGVAGAAGTGTGAGGNGGTTSFGSLCTANGGQGGLVLPATNAPAGGLGAAPGTGDVAVAGNAGGSFSNSTGLSTNVGAPGPWGGGAPAISFGSAGAHVGLPATGYGAGGSGGITNSAATNAAGGAGFQGICIVTEYGSPVQPRGSRVLLGVQTVTSPVASVDFFFVADGTYDNYEIEAYGYTVGVAGALGVRFSQDGSTFSTANNYAWGANQVNSQTTTTPGGSYAASTTYGQVQTGMDTSANSYGNYHAKLYNATRTAGQFFQLYGGGIAYSAAGGLATSTFGTWYNTGATTGPLQGIRFMNSVGLVANGITGGTFKVYGIVK